MFAAHAFTTNGWTVDIHSVNRRSEMFGAQYLHMAIPGLSLPEDYREIQYTLQGTVEGYGEKVYGSRQGLVLSPEQFQGAQDVWDIRAAYYRAWDLYQDKVHAVKITPAWMRSVLNGGYQRIIISIPAPSLCDADLHQFVAQKVWAIGDAPERGVTCPVRVAPETVVCDGTRDVGWYRASNLYGYCTVEWGESRRPPIPTAAEVLKPISTTCDCWLDSDGRVTRVGRYGTWTKGALSHQAYITAESLARKHR